MLGSIDQKKRSDAASVRSTAPTVEPSGSKPKSIAR
jgi:hypothetical protein